VQFGYDIEGAVKLDGKLTWGIDFHEATHSAYGVAHHGNTVDDYTKVRIYPDGAALETGTGTNPPTCMAWVADLLYVSLLALGDKRLKPNKTQPGGGDPLPTDGRELVWQDVTPIPEDMMKKAPRDVTVSGCNPRYDIVTGEMASPVKPYRNYLRDFGIPTGYHVHCGSGGMFCTKKWTMDESAQLTLKCMVIHCLTSYAAMGHPGSIDRWRAFGVGRFRPKPYGFEWTDLGLCAAKDMPIIMGILGAIRVFLCDWTDDQRKKLLDAVKYDDAVEAILDSAQAAGQVAQEAHAACGEIDGACRDDSAPWFRGGGYTVDINKHWAQWLKDGKVPESKTGWWLPTYKLHAHGIETACLRMDGKRGE
jgi:hypothetical protein